MKHGSAPRGLEAELAEALGRACGLALHAALRRQLLRRLGAGARELCARARAGDAAAEAELVEAAVVGETYFFRHPEQLEALARLAFRPAPADVPLRVWSAGCASGEEPYSLAAALLEAGRPPGLDRVLATDVSARALATARTGRYGRWSLRRAADGGEGPWIAPRGDAYEVAPELRAAVELRRHNLLDPPPAGPFDVIVCRNVLIYFAPAQGREVLARLAAVLRPGGWLAVAPAELGLAAGLPLEPHREGGAILLRASGRAPRAPGPLPGHARHREPASHPHPAPRDPSLGPRERPAFPGPGPALPGATHRARPATEARGAGAAPPGGPPPPAAGSGEALAFVRRALAAEARGDVDGALAELRRALYLDPDLAVAHATLVPLYRRAGRPADAERARRNAIQALEGIDDATPLLAAEALTAGALRSALGPPSGRAPAGVNLRGGLTRDHSRPEVDPS